MFLYLVLLYTKLSILKSNVVILLVADCVCQPILKCLLTTYLLIYLEAHADLLNPVNFSRRCGRANDQSVGSVFHLLTSLKVLQHFVATVVDHMQAEREVGQCSDVLVYKIDKAFTLHPT